jgi:hypothetical protein
LEQFLRLPLQFSTRIGLVVRLRILAIDLHRLNRHRRKDACRSK